MKVAGAMRLYNILAHGLNAVAIPSLPRTFGSREAHGIDARCDGSEVQVELVFV